VLRKHVHKKTIIHGGKEETLVTETTRVEQDSDPPADLSPSINAVIHQFMSSDKFGGGRGDDGDGGDDDAAGASPRAWSVHADQLDEQSSSATLSCWP